MTEEPRTTVVITGSSGLIGSALMQTLSTRFRVIGMDVRQPADVPAGAEHIPCDFTDTRSVKRAFDSVVRDRRAPIDHVIHLAAYYDFSGAPSPLYDELTVRGCERLLSALDDIESDAQLIFSSTMLVHAPATSMHEVITESSPLDAAWAYPASKIRAEATLINLGGNRQRTSLRLAGIYDEWCHSIPLAHQIDRIAARKLEGHFFPGDLKRGQPFVHLQDALTAFECTMSARNHLPRWDTFLIAEPEAASYGHLQQQIGQLLFGKDWTTIRIPAGAAKVGAWVKDKLSRGEQFIKPWMIDLADAHYPISIEHARTRLAWTPKHNLFRELEGMVNKFAVNPERWRKINGIESAAATR